MKSLVIAALALAVPACMGGTREETGTCPSGYTCSSATPNGLLFVGASLANEVELTGPAPTAVGGTQIIQLEYEPSGAVSFETFDLPFTADANGGAGVKVDTTQASSVTVIGAGAGSNYLSILDPNKDLYDEKLLTGAAIATIALTPTDGETIPAGAQVAFGAGTIDLGISLTSSGGQRLVDESMTVTVTGQSPTQIAWDTYELEGALAGSADVVISAAGGTGSATIPIEIVNEPDTITAQASAPTTIPPNGSAVVCFEATSAGVYVADLAWTFTVDGESAIASSNCAFVSTTKTSGTVAVTAMVANLTGMTTLTVTNAQVRPAPQAAPEPEAWRSPYGVRAAR